MPKPVAPRTCTWELTDDMNGPRCGKYILDHKQSWCAECRQRNNMVAWGGRSYDSYARMLQVARNYKAMYDFALAYAQLDYRTTVSLTNSPDECPWLISNQQGRLAPCQLEVAEGHLFCSRCDTKPDLPHFFPPNFIEVMLQVARANQKPKAPLRKCAQMKPYLSDDGMGSLTARWSMCDRPVKAGSLVCDDCSTPFENPILTHIENTLTATPDGQTLGAFLREQRQEIEALAPTQREHILALIQKTSGPMYLKKGALILPL